MGTIKEELKGILTLAFEVKTGLGVLEPHTPVRLTGINEYEVEPYVGPGQPDFFPHVGYVLIPNSKPGSKVVVATRARAVQRLVAGGMVSVGKPVTFNTDGKVIMATFREAQAAFKVMDFMWDGGEKLIFGTQVIQNGFEFFTGPDIPMTAQNIANAIDMHINGYRGERYDFDKVIVRRESNGPNFNNTIPEISTTDDGMDIAVDPSFAREGDISILDPYGLALTSATVPNATIDVLVL